MGFLDVEGEKEENPKVRSKRGKKRLDPATLKETSIGSGFDRELDNRNQVVRRMGRPPLNEEMTYWRIYISPKLKDQLLAVRDREGRRLNDVLDDMLNNYENGSQ